MNNCGDINNGLDKDGGSVIHSAIRANNVEMVRFLLDLKVETIPKTFYETPLHTAAEHDNPLQCGTVIPPRLARQAM